MMFSFRRADQTEIKDIQAVANATWPQTYEAILGKEQVEYMLKRLYSDSALTSQFKHGHLFYFLYSDDTLAGFSSFGKITDEVWKLHKIYILPEFQGKGSGRALIDFVIRKVTSEGAKELLLNVNRHNKARFFYEKIGFIIKEETDIDIGNGFYMNDYVMSLIL